MDAKHAPQEEDLNALHQRLRLALLAFFLRRVANVAEAEDLIQEVFVRLASTQTQMRHADAYVFQIAANLLRDRGRRLATRTWGLAEIASRDGLQSQVQDSETILISRERLKEVVGALNELGERTRAIFLLYRLEGLKHHEIGAMFGMSVSGVRKHITKAIAHLARRIGEAP